MWVDKLDWVRLWGYQVQSGALGGRKGSGGGGEAGQHARRLRRIQLLLGQAGAGGLRHPKFPRIEFSFVPWHHEIDVPRGTVRRWGIGPRADDALYVCLARPLPPERDSAVEQGAPRGSAPKAKPASSAKKARPSTQEFHGLDLAKAPRTTRASELPDLWEERPKGSRSFEIRKDVKCVYSGLDGTVYHVPAKNIFYVQSDPLGSNAMTYYGPFDGDPAKVLHLEKGSGCRTWRWSRRRRGRGRALTLRPGKRAEGMAGFTGRSGGHSSPVGNAHRAARWSPPPNPGWRAGYSHGSQNLIPLAGAPNNDPLLTHGCWGFAGIRW